MEPFIHMIHVFSFIELEIHSAFDSGQCQYLKLLMLTNQELQSPRGTLIPEMHISIQLTQVRAVKDLKPQSHSVINHVELHYFSPQIKRHPKCHGVKG